MEHVERLLELGASAREVVAGTLSELGLTDGTPWMAATAAILAVVIVSARKGAVR